MELKVNQREALLIVTALGTYQDRVGQHAKWYTRKRLCTLRARLADAITIEDDTEANTLRHVIAKTNNRIRRAINIGLEVSALRERVKSETGITDEKVSTDEDEGLDRNSSGA